MAVIYLNGTDVELHSNMNFDMVRGEIKKPSALTEGLDLKQPDKAGSKSDSEYVNSPTIADPLNLYKQSSISVSNNRFIKLNPCETTFWLMSKHPIAYLLLNLVALRAQRVSNHPSGLEVGEALIGDHESIGATRQQYRTALQVLVRNNYLTISETCRTRQKSTTGSTTKGTKVKLLNSGIWDINFDSSNHHINHRPTTDQPPTNHEQEVVVVPKKKKETTTSTQASRGPEKNQSSSSFEKLKELEERVDISEEDKLKLYEDYPIDRILAGIRSVNFSTADSPIAVLRSSIKNGWKPLRRKDSKEFEVPEFYLRLEARLKELNAPISLNINKDQAFINVDGYSSLEFDLSDPNFENEFVIKLTSLVKVYCPNQTESKEM